MIFKSQMNTKHNNCTMYSVQEYKSKTHFTKLVGAKAPCKTSCFIKTWNTVITVQYMLYKYNVQVDTDNVYLLCARDEIYYGSRRFFLYNEDDFPF